jgi:flagellin
MSAVRTNLALGLSIVNVALDAGKAIADLLTEMKAKAVQASQEGLSTDSYTALHQEFTSLRAQIETIVATAEFNGKNLIDSAAFDLKVLSTVDGSTIVVTAQNIDATTLAIHTASLSDATVAATALTAISQAIIDVSNALASLGSVAKRVEIQADFTQKLMDIVKQGVGNLVDADLAQESANLQAFQIKQQLGVQALAIVNAGPQAILSLFS